MYISEIYSDLLKRTESNADKWKIYKLIVDAEILFVYLDKDFEIKRCKFRDGSYIDIEHIHLKDGKTSIRETSAFLND